MICLITTSSRPKNMGTKLPQTAPRVTKVIHKTKDLRSEGLDPKYEPGSVLSENKVSGCSLNFPIQGTCSPSKLCIKTCYYAAGMTTWSNSLKKQIWNHIACKDNPHAFAERVVKEYRKKNLEFLRWNGGGDLFAESVEAINYIGKNYPDIVIWVVTRIPKMAALVDENPNIHLHFSLDKESLNRMEKANSVVNRRIFFSYQTDKGEEPNISELIDSGVSLFFFDNYQVPEYIYWDLKTKEDMFNYLCPLNVRRTEGKSIEGTCDDCRRCFNGDLSGPQ
jgi:hypothetical protein